MAAPNMRRWSSGFAHVYDRSVGLSARAFRDAVYAAEARRLAPVSRGFIYKPDVKVWAMEVDPVDERYLLVGTANSNILLYDLKLLDDNESHMDGMAKTNSSTRRAYDTSNLLPPCCAVRARSTVTSTSNGGTSLQYGITAVDWYPVDGGIFVSSSFDEHVKVWDGGVFQVVSEFDLHSKVYCAKFSRIASAHSLVAAATAKGEVRLCDMAIESSIHSLLGHSDEIWSLAWSLDNEYQLSTGSRDGQIRMWDIRRSGSTACLLCLNHEGHAVVPGRSSVRTNIHRLPSTSLAAAAKPPPSRKRRRLLDGQTNNNTRHLNQERRVERERKRPASSTQQGKRNDPHAAASVAFAAAHLGGVNSLAYTPDGRFLLSSGNDQKLRLWNSKTGEHAFMNYEGVENQIAKRNVQMAVIQEGDAYDSTLVFHPNGRDGQLRAYSVFGDHGTPLTSYTAHYKQIAACVYRKAYRELYTGGEDGIIMKWRPTPLELCPEDGGADSGERQAAQHGTAAGADTRIVGAAEGDVDEWSDDGEDEQADDNDPGDIFIPPILRQYQEGRH
ncbi:DNA excision repair ercc-8-like protein, partial [Globisporangium splendens]